uniref:Uncharacterized protein n=1 Tax=viral metagenome TaxID=1070528 RepID=A0A6M3LK15_9ZZZZ
MKIINEETKKKIIKELLHVWDIIGGDCLRNLEECGENPVMSRNHVAEVVCDANFLESYMSKENEDAIKEFRKLKYGGPAWKKIINEAFLYKTYGW